MIDAHSKWLEVHMTMSSSSVTTVGLIRMSFASMRLPEVIVSDNAANFTSEEFKEFLRQNGVKHVSNLPCHLASNSKVECVVQTFIDGMKKLKVGSLGTKIVCFLSSTGSCLKAFLQKS